MACSEIIGERIVYTKKETVLNKEKSLAKVLVADGISSTMFSFNCGKI